MEIEEWRYKGMRKRLVDLLETKGIYDKRVLQAINTIPRHTFIDTAFREIAYSDEAFPIGEGQTISHPFTVAFQTQLLELVKDDIVLEIGTGSGYQACVLAEIVDKVYSIERHLPLYTKTQKTFKQLGYNNIHAIVGDGFEGMPEYGPFDKIIITCGAPFIPPALLDQLQIGGQMVIPVGEGAVQQMQRITKIQAHKFEFEEFHDFKFVPMLKGIASNMH